jgi:hypothetical protein
LGDNKFLIDERLGENKICLMILRCGEIDQPIKDPTSNSAFR